MDRVKRSHYRTGRLLATPALAYRLGLRPAYRLGPWLAYRLGRSLAFTYRLRHAPAYRLGRTPAYRLGVENNICLGCGVDPLCRRWDVEAAA